MRYRTTRVSGPKPAPVENNVHPPYNSLIGPLRFARSTMIEVTLFYATRPKYNPDTLLYGTVGGVTVGASFFSVARDHSAREWPPPLLCCVVRLSVPRINFQICLSSRTR